MNSRRLRVVIVSSSYWPHEGGAERQLREVFSSDEVARELDVRVLTEPLEGMPRREVVDGLTVVRTGRKTPLVDTAGAQFGVGTLAWLARWKPDLLVSSQLGVASVAAGLHARRTGIGHVVRLSGAGFLGPREDRVDTLNTYARHWPLIRRTLQNPHCAVVAPANHMVESAIEQLPDLADRMHHIPNGVAHPVVERAPHSDGEVIWYGRNDWFKNPGDFIRLVRMSPELRFGAIGRAALPVLPNLANHGWQRDPLPTIAKARAVLLTSRYEGSPNFALQALAMGIPVVGYDIAALRELAVANPETVFLGRLGDPNSLAIALRRAVSSATCRPVTPCSVDEAATQWLALINEM